MGVYGLRIYSDTIDLSIKSAVRFDNGINFSFPDSSNAIFFPSINPCLPVDHTILKWKNALVVLSSRAARFGESLSNLDQGHNLKLSTPNNFLVNYWSRCMCVFAESVVWAGAIKDLLTGEGGSRKVGGLWEALDYILYCRLYFREAWYWLSGAQSF